ncbi:MAG: SDR family oxidoreductase, partial [Burkholderiales bacterium]
MTYFVTGATGFVGKFLVTNLLKRDSGKAGTIYVLVRKQSMKKFDEVVKWWGLDPKTQRRVVAINGDLSKPKLGLAPAYITKVWRTRVPNMLDSAIIHLAPHGGAKLKCNFAR